MRKMAPIFAQCLLGCGMVYATVVLTATPARAAACDCNALAQAAPELCYDVGGFQHDEADDNTVGPNDGARVLSCNSSSWTIECEDGYIFSGGCS